MTAERPSGPRGRTFSLGLAGQLSRASIAVVVAVVLAVGSALLTIAYEGERRSSHLLIEKHAEKVGILISTFVEDTEATLDLIESVIDPRDETSSRVLLEKALTHERSPFTQLTLLDDSGIERIKVSRFHTYLPEELGARAKDPAFEAAIRGRTYLSPVQVADQSGFLSLVLAVPARHPSFEGVLLADVEMSRLWTEISRIDIGRDGYAYLVDGSGRFLAFQRPSEVLRRYGEDLRHLPPVSSHMARDGQRARSSIHEYTGLTGSAVVGLEKDIGETGWAVVVELPIDEAFESSRRMRWLWLGLGLLGIIGAGLGGLFVSRRLLRPIRALTLATERIGKGDLQAELAVDTDRDDEVGALGRAFERMQEELRSLYARLEQRVSELTLAREALAASEETYRAIFENSGTSLAIIDKEMVFEMVNREFENLTGFPKEAIERTRTLEDCIAKPDCERVLGYHAQRRAEKGSAPKTYEFEMCVRDGSKKRVVATVELLPGDEKSLIALLDVTEQRRAEEARTLLQEQLRQAQKMESIGRLAGGVAHDFNNILTAIYGNLELALLEMSPRDPQIPRLEEIRRAAQSAEGLTRQLLAFSRKQIIAPREVDLNHLVGSFSKMLARLLGENIRLDFVPASAPCHVMVDPGQIEQIVINLAVNARDAMPEGGRLAIELVSADLDEAACASRPRLSPGPHVMLSVEDTGIGMTDEVMAKIFEPFFTTKELGRGTGLGLATVLGAVEQNAGSIEVHSALGHGSKFSMFFPRIEGKGTRVPSAEREALLHGSETILFVEDNSLIRTSTRHLLSILGYRVIDASSAEEAITLFARVAEEIDLLLTDVVLPGMDGHALAERLVAVRPALEVLFTSGYTDNPLVTEGVLSRRLHFLAKPYTAEALVNSIRAALAKAG